MRGWYNNRQAHSLASRGIRIKLNNIIKNNYWTLENIDEDKINTIIEMIDTIRESESVFDGGCSFTADLLEDISGGRRVDGWVYNKKGNILMGEEDKNEFDAWYHSWIVLKDGTIIDPTFHQFYVNNSNLGNCKDDFVKCFGKKEWKGKIYPKYMIAIIPKNHQRAKMYSSHSCDYSEIPDEIKEINEKYKQEIREEGFDLP